MPQISLHSDYNIFYLDNVNLSGLESKGEITVLFLFDYLFLCFKQCERLPVIKNKFNMHLSDTFNRAHKLEIDKLGEKQWFILRSYGANKCLNKLVMKWQIIHFNVSFKKVNYIQFV